MPSKLGPTGKTLAVGLAALVAEVGVLWLHRRAERAAQDPKPAISNHLISQSLEEVYIWLQEGGHQGRILARRELRSFGTTKSTDARG